MAGRRSLEHCSIMHAGPHSGAGEAVCRRHPADDRTCLQGRQGQTVDGRKPRRTERTVTVYDAETAIEWFADRPGDTRRHGVERHFAW